MRPLLAAVLVPAAVSASGASCPVRRFCYANSGVISSLKEDPVATPFCADYLSLSTETVTEYQTITQSNVYDVEPVTVTGDAVTSVETDVRVVVETVTEYTTEKITETETKTRYTSTITCLDSAYTAKPPTVFVPPEKRVVETPAAIPGDWPEGKVSLACSCLSVPAPKTTVTISETVMPTTIISTSTDVVISVEEYTETVLSTSVSTYTSTVTDEKTVTTTAWATTETIASNGARYRRYTHPFVAGGSEPYTSSYFKDKSPVANGVIDTLSWNNYGSGLPASFITLPGHDPSTRFDAWDAAILVNGFFLARETGTYTFRSDGESIDDWGYLWVRDAAYSQWGDGNAAFKAASAGRVGGTFQVEMKKGDAVPVTWLWTNGRGLSNSNFEVELPGGFVIAGAEWYLVQACSEGVFA